MTLFASGRKTLSAATSLNALRQTRYYRKYNELKYMEQHSRQIAVAASATLSAVRRNGLSEVAMWVVGRNNCCLLWGLYRAHKYNLWSECRHVACSVHIVTTVLQTLDAPYRPLTSFSHSVTSSRLQLRATSLAVWPLLFFTLTSAPLSTSSFTTDKCPNCTV